MAKKNEKKMKKNVYDMELLEKTNEEYLEIFKKHVSQNNHVNYKIDKQINNKDVQEIVNINCNKSPILTGNDSSHARVNDNIINESEHGQCNEFNLNEFGSNRDSDRFSESQIDRNLELDRRNDTFNIRFREQDFLNSTFDDRYRNMYRRYDAFNFRNRELDFRNESFNTGFNRNDENICVKKKINVNQFYCDRDYFSKNNDLRFNDCNSQSEDLRNNKYTKPWIANYSTASEFHLSLKRKSCSVPHFGVSLMLNYFEKFELKDPDTNVNGRAPKGSLKEMRPLSPKRMKIIEEAFFNNCGLREEEKQKGWKQAVDAMNKKMSCLKKQI